MNLFECKIRYEKTFENGLVKKVTEAYLVDAMSFTEAEARICKEIAPFISGGFEVSAIRRYNSSEMFADPAGDKWYRCKVMFITIDERSGAEKKTASYMLVQSTDLKTAREKLESGMKGTMADYDNAEIKETNIIDIFLYQN